MKSRQVVWILVFCVAVLYLPFLGNGFVSDDSSIIAMADPRATWLRALGWPTAIHLGGLVHFWLYHVVGPVPWPYRLMNILVHAGNVILIWLIVRKHAASRIAFVAALLFAIHPLVIESVMWIAGGVVYAYAALFFLLSLYWYGNASLVKRTLSLLSFVVALGMSDKVLPLCVMMILYEWMFGNLKKHWGRWAGYIAVSLPFILFYVTRLGPRMSAGAAGSSSGLSPWVSYVLKPVFAVSSYLELFVWPKNLTLYHVGLIHSWTEAALRIAVTGAFSAVTLIGLVRRKQWGFWLAWVLIALAVTLLPINIAWIVAERYVYLGLVGLCATAAMLFDWIVSSEKRDIIGICVGVAVVIALSTRTIIRNSEWRSEDTLWVATLRESPEDPKSWNNIGDVYARHGLYEKSIAAFTRAAKLDPAFADAYYNIGFTYMQMKKYAEAEPFFTKALALDPGLWEAYLPLAVIAEEKKDTRQALEYIDQAVAVNPTDPALRQNAQRLRSVLQ